MNREILFKAKRKDSGEWVEGYYRRIPCMGLHEHYIMPQNPKNRLEQYEIDPDTICQYTGFTDKNGQKIWENDVVRYYDNLANMNKEDLVKWNETHASFVRLHKSKMGSQYLYIDECIANRCEVIGNIFDNPELLGGGE